MGYIILGGMPWVLVFDNMRTVVRMIAKRDKDGNPIWNRRFRQFASEMDFHPDVCDPGAANQKGTVENGVKFVKGNFLAGRTFLDDEDLSMQLTQWLSERNNQKCQAHGYTPNQLLPEEREALARRKKPVKPQYHRLYEWYAWADSNRQPSDPESNALSN